MTPTPKDLALLQLVRRNRGLLLDAIWLASLRCAGNMELTKGDTKIIRRWLVMRSRFNNLHAALEKALQ